MSKLKEKENESFEQIKTSFLDYDPAFFVENNLTLDGEEFKIIGNGWKFMVDIYRYVGLQATQKTGKPVVLKKGRQVGATIMAGALDLYFTNSGLFNKPPIRVLHAFPSLAQVKKFSQDKLEGLIRTSKHDIINKGKLSGGTAVDNLTMKQFNGGTLWVDSIGEDGDRVRGMTIDVLLTDELQDCYAQAIGNATKTLTAAKYGSIGNGVQLYFGTPKDNNSYFSRMWDSSDQRYYHLGCKNCGETYPFYLPEDDRWKEIWVGGHIIKCPLCGTQQTKVEAVELGKWVPSRPSEECKFVGFHINQLYIPNFTKENIIGLMPENNPLQTERLFRNEVLGEFYSGAGLPITKEEIRNLCRDPDRSFARSINPKDKNTYLGADWGGKDEGKEGNVGQSYSCVVVLSSQPDGTLLIEHAHKLKKQGSDYRKETINEMYKRFGVKQGVADFFFGQSEVRDLTAIYGGKFLGAQGSGSLIAPLKFREDELIIGYNKDMMVQEVFDLFRAGKIRFPWKSFEYIEWLIDHCTSMESSIKTVGGQPMKTYSKGTTPNDGLMALMYAVMAYKFDITNKFTIKPGNMNTKVTRPPPVLAKVSRRF